MNAKIVENIINGHKRQLMSDVSGWMSYLETVSYHYKHSLNNQVMINIYMPEAKACGNITTWCKLNRDIVSENGVPIIQDGELGYLYDISQTSKRADGTSKNPWIWSVSDNKLNVDFSDTVNSVLSKKHDLNANTLFENLYELAFKLTDDRIYANNKDKDYANLIAESSAYSVMMRCCPDKVGISLVNLKKLHEYKFDTAANDVNRVVSEIMAEIEELCKVERSKYTELWRKNNDIQRGKNDRGNTSRSEQRDKRMVTGGDVRQAFNDMDTGRTLGKSEISSAVGEETQSIGDYNGNEKTAVLGNGRSGEASGGTYENDGSDRSGIRVDSDGRSAPLLSDRNGVLENDTRRNVESRAASREIHNDAPRLSDESSRGRISENEVTRDSQAPLSGGQSEGTFDARYADGKNAEAKRGVSESQENGRLYENSTSDGNVQGRSGRSSSEGNNLRLKAAEYGYYYPGMQLLTKEEALNQYIEGRSVYLLYPDNTEGEAETREEINAFEGFFGLDVGVKALEKDYEIFGNTIYKYIPAKTYRKFESETALKIAAVLSKNGIKFSGKIAGENTTLTFSKGDLSKVEEIASEFAIGESEKHIKLLTVTQLGSFFEFHGEAAEIVAKELDLTLTRRDNMPLCGIPEHNISTAIAKLKEKGYDVTLEQENSPLANDENPLIAELYSVDNRVRVEVLKREDATFGYPYDVRQTISPNRGKTYIYAGGDSKFHKTVNEAMEYANKLIAEANERAAEKYPEPYNIPEPHSALPGEPIVTFSNSEHPEINGELKFPLSQADRIIAELDEKQRSDREIYENVGWYRKTDFLIEFEIDGDKQRYEGRYDIGDGDGTLINHIKSYTEYMLENINKFYHDDETKNEAKERFSHILNEMIPRLEKYTEVDKFSPTISADKYEVSNADIVEFKSNGRNVKSVDIPIVVSDELRRRFELYGLKPSDEQTQITLSTYGDDWNRFEIRDKFGNRFVNVKAEDMLTFDELETMKSVVSDFYTQNQVETISDVNIESVAETGKNLYVSDSEDFEQMSLFGDSETAELNVKPFSKLKSVSNTAPTISMSNHILRGGSGRSGFNVGYDSKGLEYIKGDLSNRDCGVLMNWNEISNRIERLISEDKYITQKDIENKMESESYDIEPDEEIVENYHINEDDLSMGGAKSQFKANITAIQTLKMLEAEERPATPEEQQLLSRYAGWGGLSSAFDSTKSEWANEYAQLKATLTDEEYVSARATVGDSFYTPPYIIDSIYSALKNMGFDGGNILEPALGVGNFLGKMPEDMFGKSQIYGTELDNLSGRIAKKLYPDADISVTGFEKKDYSDGFFDVAVGNVPFGSFKIPDRKYDRYNFAVHDYFFAKTLDKVRPGGIVAFITSKGTLDKANPAVRKYISQRAELLGAIRLPNNAFKSYARTEVTSDIIFLQKREKMIDIAPEWVYTANDTNGLPCNQYFIDNPDMILGETVEGNKLYGSGTMVVPFENADLKELLSKAVEKIHGTYEKEKAVVAKNTKQVNDKPDVIPADPSVKNFTYTEIDGKLYYRENSVMTEMQFKGKKLDRIKGMAAINKCVRELLDMQLADYPKEDIEEKQSELNTLHDKFIKEFGLLSSRTNKSAFKEDISYPLLMSLEKVKDGKLEAKADIFTKRTIRPPVKITHVDTAVEALAVSISEKACVDIEFMSSLMGAEDKIEQIISDLKGVIYKNPENDDNRLFGWETADEYLSGNIREKLEVAKAAAENDEVYSENVSALESVMPKKLQPGEINVKLGSAWIDTKFVEQFIYETLSTPLRCQGENRICVKHSIKTATWTILNKSLDSGNVKANVTYGTIRKSAYEIIEDSLNQRDTTVNDRVEDEEGNTKYVLNHKETLLARQKQDALNLAFHDWIFKDHERRDYLVEKYNVMFNSIRPREYDGSHLTFVGMNPEKELRPHQKNAVAHALYGGNTLFAHEVGAGKTYEMIATAMEGKRLGLCTKSLIAVPNHMTEQFANDFLDLYPNANILVAGENDFSKENRQKLCAKISTGDFDAVIIGHSQLIKIGVSPEREEVFIRQQIDEMTNDIADIKAQNGENFTIKEMEKSKKDMKARLEKLLSKTEKDDVITFEQLGIDKLFIDEADMFKNLGLSTKMRNISGVASNTKVQKTQDLYLKCQYLDELTGGKGIVFATGTPVSNSISEIFTMQRYLQSDLLKKHQLTHFDTWAANFAEKVTKLEFAPEGTGFRQKTRLAKFYNLPELMTMFKECADIKTADDLNLPTPEREIHNVAVQPTQVQKDLVAALGERAEKIHNKMVTPDVDNMLKITTDGRKIGLEQRLINPMLPDEEGTKVNTCINNVYRIWNETSENRSTQLIFCDYGVPMTTKSKKDKKGKIVIEEEADFSKFNVYDDIKNKLIERGVPENEIAFIHSAKTKEAKEKLFESIRRGDVRILIGSTSKMGTGTNVQNKLVASHDLDCPWKPRDMEQRRGRMVRQGNENEKVHLFRYVTQDTFDAYLFQTLENKQKFISQIMSSKTPARSCDDIDDSTLSYAEVKALCIANPHIKEKMELDIEVSKLQLIKSNFMNEHYRLEDEGLKKLPTQIATSKEMLKYYQADLKQTEAYPVSYDDEGKEKFYPMTISGKVYTEKQDAGKALIEQALKVTVASGKNAVAIGEYKGFKLDVFLDSLEGCVKMSIKGMASYSITMSESAIGNITRIDNAISNIEKRVAETEDNIKKLEIKLEDSKAELMRPFPQEQELSEKLARQTELSYLLNLDNGKEETLENSKESEIPQKQKNKEVDDVSL